MSYCRSSDRETEVSSDETAKLVKKAWGRVWFGFYDMGYCYVVGDAILLAISSQSPKTPECWVYKLSSPTLATVGICV